MTIISPQPGKRHVFLVTVPVFTIFVMDEQPTLDDVTSQVTRDDMAFSEDDSDEEEGEGIYS